MSRGQVVIDEMQLNIPGMDRHEADLLGREIVKRLNNLIKDTEITQRTINSMDLNVEIPKGTPKEQLAEIIANQMCKSLI